MSEQIFVFGASGHAKVVIDALRCSEGFDIALLLDDDPARLNAELLGYRVAGGREKLAERRSEAHSGIVAIGDNVARLAAAKWLAAAGFGFVSVIHPRAVVAVSASVGAGTLVMPGCVVNADARIGAHVIVNTAATVDHDCIVQDGAHLGPGTHLCGSVFVGRGSLVGAGSVVLPGVRIGDDVLIGAGSTVLNDIPDGARAVGSPCRILRSAV
jgi:sugar O-acyltransferase (sialic acid O-acetyltransferase NeuD family)